MSFNVVLEIAIGLALMYLVLSLACTAINEVIATLASLRAKSLRNAIEQILDHPELREAFYKNGLISSTNEIVEKGGIVGSTHPSYIPSRTFALSLLASLDKDAPVPAMQTIKENIYKLPEDSRIRSVLLAQLADASDDLDKFRTNVASWFDDTMARVSGVYTRKVKLISFLVGLALAVALNADTVKVGSTLWSDQDMRAQIAEMAKRYAEAVQPAPQPGAPPASADELKKRLDDAIDAIKKAKDDLRPLPIGWSVTSIAQNPSYWDIFYKIVGLLLTAIALSLGAQFWFDTLQKFVNLRGAGPKPEKVTPGA